MKLYHIAGKYTLGVPLGLEALGLWRSPFRADLGSMGGADLHHTSGRACRWGAPPKGDQSMCERRRSLPCAFDSSHT
jgi:hypothetical protein